MPSSQDPEFAYGIKSGPRTSMEQLMTNQCGPAPLSGDLFLPQLCRTFRRPHCGICCACVWMWVVADAVTPRGRYLRDFVEEQGKKEDQYQMAVRKIPVMVSLAPRVLVASSQVLLGRAHATVCIERVSVGKLLLLCHGLSCELAGAEF